MELAFNFAERITNINFVDVLLNDNPKQLLILSITLRDLHACNPLVGLYDNCIMQQKSKRFSNVVEYLYYSLMYKSIIPISIHKYLADPIERSSILLRVRKLEAKHKSIASFVDRLYSIFEKPKFSKTLRLEPIYNGSYSAMIKRFDGIYVTMRFNYLNRIVIKIYTEPSTTIKILMYLILLR